MKKLGRFYTILVLTFFALTARAEVGIYVEEGQVIKSNNPTPQFFLDHKEDIHLLIGKTKLDVGHKKAEHVEYEKFLKYSENDKDDHELYEYVGMFISDYKSTKKLKVKVKLDSSASLEKAYLNYKIKF